MASKNTKPGNGIGHKGGAQGSGKDGEAKKAQRIQAEAEKKAANAAKNAVKAKAKLLQPKPETVKSFDEVFVELLAKQAALNTNLFFGPLGKYSLQVNEKKLIVNSFQNEKGVQFECLVTNFGFTSKVFITEGLVKGFTSEKFTPNFNLPEHVQAQQKELHTFLRTAYEQTYEFVAKQNQVAKPNSPAKLTLVPFVPNKFANFAREERTCSDVRVLVMGRVQVYRIADANGKYAVLSCTSQGSDVKVIYITLKFLQEGHELAGKLPLNTMVELHKLLKESLGTPQGEFAQRKSEQGVLHGWLRSRALAAGLKDKKPVAQRKAA